MFINNSNRSLYSKRMFLGCFFSKPHENISFEKSWFGCEPFKKKIKSQTINVKGNWKERSNSAVTEHPHLFKFGFWRPEH